MSPFRERVPSEPPSLSHEDYISEINRLLECQGEIGALISALESCRLLDFIPDFEKVLTYIDDNTGAVRDENGIVTAPLNTILHILSWISHSQLNCSDSVDILERTGALQLTLRRLRSICEEMEDR